MYYTMKFTGQDDFKGALKQYKIRKSLYKGLSLLIKEQKLLGNMDAVKHLGKKIKELKEYEKYIDIGLSWLNERERHVITEIYFKNKTYRKFAIENNYKPNHVNYIRYKACKVLCEYCCKASQGEIDYKK